jgi:hypothetical protein
MPVMPTLLPRDYVALLNASNSPAKPMVKGAMLAMPKVRQLGGGRLVDFVFILGSFPAIDNQSRLLTTPIDNQKYPTLD